MKIGTLIARIAYTILFVPLAALGVVAVALQFVAHGLAWVFLAPIPTTPFPKDAAQCNSGLNSGNAYEVTDNLKDKACATEACATEACATEACATVGTCGSCGQSWTTKLSPVAKARLEGESRAYSQVLGFISNSFISRREATEYLQERIAAVKKNLS